MHKGPAAYGSGEARPWASGPAVMEMPPQATVTLAALGVTVGQEDRKEAGWWGTGSGEGWAEQLVQELLLPWAGWQ